MILPYFADSLIKRYIIFLIFVLFSKEFSTILYKTRVSNTDLVRKAIRVYKKSIFQKNLKKKYLLLLKAREILKIVYIDDRMNPTDELIKVKQYIERFNTEIRLIETKM